MSSRRSMGQFQIQISPQHQGAFTRCRVVGSVPTAIPRHHLRPLMRAVSFWSGWPVSLALPVEVATVAWFEQWADGLADIPEDHLQMRLVRTGRTRSAGTQRDE
jgi:hypothetical protein